MTLIRIGDQTLQLALVMRFKESQTDAGLRVELEYLNGSTVCLEGVDAERLRRWLRLNSASLEPDPAEAEFASPGGAEGGGLLAHPQRGQQGA